MRTPRTMILPNCTFILPPSTAAKRAEIRQQVVEFGFGKFVRAIVRHERFFFFDDVSQILFQKLRELLIRVDDLTRELIFFLSSALDLGAIALVDHHGLLSFGVLLARAS